MERIITLMLLLLLTAFDLSGQCDLDFGSGAVPAQFTFMETGGTDIVNGGSSGSLATDSQSFDIWDEATNNCGAAGGLEDITFDFEIIHAFDQYDIDGIIDTYAGGTHDIDQSSSGLRGNVPMGNSGANDSSAGDVRGYKITVSFASHVAIIAQDLLVNLTSVNTAGRAHESCALVFLDETGTPYGTATYDGFYVGTTGATNDASCTAPAARTNSWSTSLIGAYTASSTANVVGSPDACTSVSGTNGTNDNHDIDPVTDAGLSATDPIGGFVFTVYLEDVAASTAPGAETSTVTQFTSTLNGISVASIVLPVEIADFNVKTKDDVVEVNWSTASEENNDHFDVEWSTDGEHFETIGTIQGAGNSFEMQQYNYVHAKPVKGENYYRLKQVDFNGQFSFSAIKMAKIESDDRIAIFPTMVKESLNIIKPASESTISIYTIEGVLVRKILNHSGGKLQIETADFASGNYFVTVHSGNRTFTERFIKL